MRVQLSLYFLSFLFFSSRSSLSLPVCLGSLLHIFKHNSLTFQDVYSFSSGSHFFQIFFDCFFFFGNKNNSINNKCKLCTTIEMLRNHTTSNTYTIAVHATLCKQHVIATFPVLSQEILRFVTKFSVVSPGHVPSVFVHFF